MRAQAGAKSKQTLKNLPKEDTHGAGQGGVGHVARRLAHARSL